MKSLGALLVLILFTCNHVHSQYAQLKVFTNYKTCQHGLKDREGKTVLPAEFDLLGLKWHGDYDYNPRHYFWAAQKNGFYGLLTDQGEELIPFSYNNINVHYDVISANDDAAAYLFTLEGKLIKRFEGYSSISPHPTGYFFQKNGQVGLLDTLFIEILPPSYDRMNFAAIRDWDEGVSRLVSNRFIELEKKGRRGIFDLKTKKLIVPLTSELLHINHTGPSDCENSDAFIRAYDPQTNIDRIINSDGVQVYSDQHFPQYFRHISIPSDSCGSDSIQLAYIEKGRKMRVLNIKTGTYSNEHEEIYPLKGYSVFFDKNKWGVIYPDFKESKAYTQPKYELSKYTDLETSFKLNIANERYHQLFQYLNFRDRIDSILQTKVIVGESKKNEEEYELFGLFNFRTGKKIKPKYHEIKSRNLSNQTVYWAFIYDSPHIPYYHRTYKRVDIYDSELNVIKQLENIEEYEFENHVKDSHNVTLKKDGLKGVLDVFGNQIIPIEFEECRQEAIRVSNDSETTRIYYWCSNSIDKSNQKTQTYLFKSDGKLLIPKHYQNISFYDNKFIGRKPEGTFDLYTLRGELLLTDVNSFQYAPFIDEFGNCFEEKDERHIERPECMYVVKDNYIHAFVNDSLLRLDENYLQFTENYCFFLHFWVIDNKGKIISLDPKGIHKRPKWYSSKHERQRECSTFFDEYPVAYVEPIKSIPRELPPTPELEKVPTFQFRLRNAYKENNYYLYSPRGDLKYSTPFDFPTPTDDVSYKIFRQNGKYGRFDRNFNIDMEAKYDFISPDGRFAQKDGLWYMRKGISKEWSEGFKAISDDQYEKHHFVFVDGKIGLMNNSLEYILPLTDSATFIEKFDLVKTLELKGLSNYARPHKSSEVIFNATPTDLYRRINNFQLVEKAYYKSISNKKMKVRPVDTSFPNLPRDLLFLTVVSNENPLFKERVPTYYTRYYYSEIIFSRSLGDEVNHYQNLRIVSDRTLYNYKIVNDELVPITLEDILKTDSQSTEQLNKLLIEKANEIQAYGPNCVDMESKLEDLKSNFVISGGSLVFYGYWNGSFDISLSFKDLKPIMRYPNKML